MIITIFSYELSSSACFRLSEIISLKNIQVDPFIAPNCSVDCWLYQYLVSYIQGWRIGLLMILVFFCQHFGNVMTPKFWVNNIWNEHIFVFQTNRDENKTCDWTLKFVVFIYYCVKYQVMNHHEKRKLE